MFLKRKILRFHSMYRIDFSRLKTCRPIRLFIDKRKKKGHDVCVCFCIDKLRIYYFVFLG